MSDTTNNLDNNMDNNLDNNSNDGEDIQFFKGAIQEYLKQNDEISVLSDELNIRKSKQKNMGETIRTYIEEKDISHVNLQGNYSGKRIQTVRTETLSSIKESDIIDVLNNYFEDKNEVDKIIDLINATRIKRVRISLKIQKEKKNKIPRSQTLTELIEDKSNQNGPDKVPEHLKYLYNNVNISDNEGEEEADEEEEEGEEGEGNLEENVENNNVGEDVGEDVDEDVDDNDNN